MNCGSWFHAERKIFESGAGDIDVAFETSTPRL